MSPSQSPSKPRRLPPRSASFNSRTESTADLPPRDIPRPKTQPDVLAAERRPSISVAAGGLPEAKLPAKVLVRVTVQRSPGPVHVMAALEWTVDQLVSAALRVYIREERRPAISSGDPAVFGLHYSQFSLENLDSRERLINLGSRSFFLCPRSGDSSNAVGGNGGLTAAVRDGNVGGMWRRGEGLGYRGLISWIS